MPIGNKEIDWNMTQTTKVKKSIKKIILEEMVIVIKVMKSEKLACAKMISVSGGVGISVKSKPCQSVIYGKIMPDESQTSANFYRKMR